VKEVVSVHFATKLKVKEAMIMESYDFCYNSNNQCKIKHGLKTYIVIAILFSISWKTPGLTNGEWLSPCHLRLGYSFV